MRDSRPLVSPKLGLPSKSPAFASAWVEHSSTNSRRSTSRSLKIGEGRARYGPTLRVTEVRQPRRRVSRKQERDAQATTTPTKVVVATLRVSDATTPMRFRAPVCRGSRAIRRAARRECLRIPYRLLRSHAAPTLHAHRRQAVREK